MNWNDKDRKYIWHPFTQLTKTLPPLMVKKAEGVYLYLEDGRKIIDAISSWWVNLHGHSHPYIAQRIATQAANLEHVIFAGFTHQPAIQLAENLLSVLPNNQSKIFYSDNGSTAVEVGLKMAFQYWYNKGITRQHVIAIKGAYHGDTFGGMAVGERGPFSAAFDDYLFNVDFIDFPDAQNEKTALQQFKKLVDKGNVAAFIFEPLVQGSSGMRMYSANWLDAAIAYAKKNDVICIADEVFTGFYRTGKFFAADYIESKPDIFCLSKGLTGGSMALGVTSCTEAIIDAYRSDDILKTFFHGHSFTANPIACTAANASFELLQKKDCQENIANIRIWQDSFKTRIEGHKGVRKLRTLGTILALELETNQESSYINEVRHKLYPYFLDRGILLRPLGNVIYVLPPYVINKEQMIFIYEQIEALLNEI